MKISLQPPFDAWKKGYLRTSKDGRKRIDLFNSENDRTTTSYARYLMGVELGRLLSPDEEVDHVDGNKNNDSIANLQVLSKEDHKVKTKREVSGRTYISLVCPNCNNKFEKEKRQIKKNTNPKCSRKCNGEFSRRLQLSKK